MSSTGTASAKGEMNPNGAIQTAGQSAYDAHHPPAGELIDQCVHCGFCLPVCPTYILWKEEMDSPRGRIYLMKMAAEGDAAINQTWVRHFDACLGCMPIRCRLRKTDRSH
jgi:glycolate oxidase iron-sulfur subunit